MKGNKPRLGQLLITIDPGLSGAETYNKRIAAFLAMLASDDGIRLPGQRRFAQRAQALRSGVTVNDAVVQEIKSGISKRWNN
jgi:(2R)-3-sulfolactate dehydrogenase (NADP+)